MKFSTAFFALAPFVAAVSAATAEQGNVFACVNAGFVAPCQIFHGASGQCVPFPADFDNNVSAFGPDADQSCFIFENSDCTGATNGPIQQPGIANLTTIGFNDIVSSFECFF